MEKITVQKEIPEKIIPAHIIPVNKYVAFDGKEFDHEWECKKYEKQLEKAQSYMQGQRIRFITKENDIFKFDSENICQLFYIRNKNDIREAEKILSVTFFRNSYPKSEEFYYNTDYCDFELYGEGWYLFWLDPGGDYDDDIYLMNWNHYINELIKSVQRYSIKIQRVIDIKNKELQEKGVIGDINNE